MSYGAPPLFRQGVPAKARFIFFLTLSLALILVDGRLRALDGLRSTIVSFTAPVVETVSLPALIIADGEGYLKSKHHLNEEINKLSTENQLLQLQAARFEEIQKENEELRRLVNAVPRTADRVATGEVIGRIADPFSRRIKINIGTPDGLAVGMPVLGPFGVLGQISRVVNRLSEVTLLTDHTSRLAVINRRTGAFHVLAGTGSNTLSLLYVQPSEDIQPGDELITSGLDNLFPKQVLAARVTEAGYRPGEPYQNVSATLAADIENVQFATVVLVEPSTDVVTESAPPSRFERRQRR